MKRVFTFQAVIEIEADTDANGYIPVLDATAGALLRAAFPNEGRPFEVDSFVVGPNIGSFDADGRARLTVDKGMFEVAEGGLADVGTERP